MKTVNKVGYGMITKKSDTSLEYSPVKYFDSVINPNPDYKPPLKRLKTIKSFRYNPDDVDISISVSGVPGEYERNEIIRAVTSTICRLNNAAAERYMTYEITIGDKES